MLVLLMNSIAWDTRVKKIVKELDDLGKNPIVISVEQEGTHLKIVGNAKLKPVFFTGGRYFFPGVSRILLFYLFLREAARQCTQEQVIWCNDLNTLLTGCILKLIFKLHLIYDTHEYAVDEIIGASKAVILLKKYYQRFLIRFADKVVSVSPLIAKQLQIDNPFLKDVVVLKNLPDIDLKKRLPINLKEKYSIPSKNTVIVYHGSISNDYVVNELLKAFKFMEWPNVSFLVLGMGSRLCELRRRSSSMHHVNITDALPIDQLHGVLVSCDFGLVVYPPGCLNHEFCFPNKYFDYLANGVIPLIPDLQQMKEHIRETGFGCLMRDLQSYDDLIEAKSSMKMLFEKSNIQEESLWASHSQIIEERVIR
jgi:hypothetical protein